MAILFSKKTRVTAESYSLTGEELAFADLLACGWDSDDAYLLAFRTETWTASAIRRSARETAAKIGIKKRVKELRKGVLNAEAQAAAIESANAQQEEDIAKALSKESMLKDLYLARKKMTPGSKDWLETNKMIADITRMKQEEIKKDDDLTHYYLPLTCEHCSLYLKSKE